MEGGSILAHILRTPFMDDPILCYKLTGSSLCLLPNGQFGYNASMPPASEIDIRSFVKFRRKFHNSGGAIDKNQNIKIFYRLYKHIHNMHSAYHDQLAQYLYKELPAVVVV